MIRNNVTWSVLKNFAVSRNLSLQWYIDGNNWYQIYGIDENLSLETCIPLDGSMITEQTDFETNFKLNGNGSLSSQISPFASKILHNGKRIFKREHGIQQNLTQGINNIIYIIPYSWVKILGVEVIGGEIGDFADLMVLDSISGTYSTVPNLVLNQFGFSVNIAPGEYSEETAYDADLYIGMQIKIVYNSKTAKTIGINFNLNEVK